MINVPYSILLIAVMSGVSALLRFLPFIIFHEGRETPQIITYLGKYLPPALIAMLVIYCFKSVSIVSRPHGLPEFIAAALVAILHIWKRNTLLSIGAGTICYMILIQFVFV